MSAKTAYRRERRRREQSASVTGDETVKRPVPGQMFGKKDVAYDDSDFAAMYPLLAEMLSAQCYEDGVSRATSTILIFVDAGALKLCLNDRDNNRSLFVNASTHLGLLTECERLLETGEAEWKSKSGFGKADVKTPF